jgi:microcystin-dependent protein
MCLSPSGGITIRSENLCRSNEMQVDPAAVSATVAHEMEQIAALQAQTAEQAAQISTLQGEKTEIQSQVSALQTTAAEQADQLAEVQTKVSQALPPGSILDFGGATAPAGYLLCNGEAVSRSEYPDLYAAIGTSFGGGDGSTTFNVPDLRGRFTRGVDAAAGHDPDADSRGESNPGGNAGDAVGSLQGDGFRSHTHRQSVGALPGTGIFANDNAQPGYFDGQKPGNGVTTQPTGGRETRPVNVAVNRIIKY